MAMPLSKPRPGGGQVFFVETNKGNVEVAIDNPAQKQEDLFQQIVSQLPRQHPSLFEQPKSTMRSIGEAVAPSALPMAGEMGGATLGAMTGPAAPVAIPVLSAAGGAAGEYANQLLGVTEPSNLQIGLASVAGPAARVAGYASKGLLRYAVSKTPGAAVVLNEEAIRIARGLPSLFEPVQQTIDRARVFLKQLGNPRMSMSNTHNAAVELLGKELRKVDRDTNMIDMLKRVVNSTKGGWDFETIKINAEDFGKTLGSLKKTGRDKAEEAYGHLYKSLHADMEAGIPFGLNQASAAALLKSDMWRAVRVLERRQFAALDLKKMVEESISVVGDQYQQINPNVFLKKLKNMEQLYKQDKQAKLFMESFYPGEIDQLKETFQSIGKMAPRIPPATGAQFGSGAFFKATAKRSAFGAGVGYMVGGQEGAAIGAAVGGIGGQVASDLISSAVMTERGRWLVARLFAQSPTINHQKLAMLAAFLRSQTATPGPAMTGVAP